jgi:hypothetical protein
MCYSYQQGLDFGFAERSVVNPDIVDGAVEVEVRFGRSFSSDVQRLFGVGAQPSPPPAQATPMLPAAHGQQGHDVRVRRPRRMAAAS